MDDKKRNYRSIFKATAFLSVVQFVNILIKIIQNKVVSMLLGPSGMGIVGLLQSSSNTISGFTNCGVSVSSVKNIAQAYEKGNLTQLGKVLFTVRRLVGCTGTFASLVMLILCRQLSFWSFGNYDFALSFACLSISLLFTQMTHANTTILKGCRKLRYYAKANILGNIFSLIITIPLYYIWGKDAIVPVLILVSVSTFVFSYIYERKTGIKEEKTSKVEFKAISVDILKMGIPLACSEIFPIMASYLIRLHVSSGGGISDVGLYSAGFAILNGYVGMIFTAMSSDYIPRLSAIIDDNRACEITINSQIILSILLLFPILLSVIVFGKLIIWILYSSEFFSMIGMLYWGAIGMLYKAVSWSMGCTLVPKREAVFYFLTSILSAAVYMGTSMWFYNLWGVTGLGVAFFVSNLFDAIGITFYLNYKFTIKIDSRIFLMLVPFSAILMLTILLNRLDLQDMLVYAVEGLLLIICAAYSFWQLNRMMDLKKVIQSKLNKKK